MWSITRRILFIALLVLGGLLGGAPRNAAADVPGTAFDTSFQIQNLGSAPASCTYDIYSNAGGAASFQQAIASTIPVGGSVLVYTGAAANGGTSIPAGVNSGVVSCDQEVAAVVVFQNATKRDAYVATKTPAATMYAPAVYKNYYNFDSTVRVQNTSATPQSVTISYYAPGVVAAVATQTANLAANGSVSFEPNSAAALQANVSYSAKIVGSQPLAVNVSLYGKVGTSVEPEVYSYSGFAGGSLKIFTPVVLKNYYGFNSATNIQNTGASTANVKRTFSNGLVENFTIAAGSSVARLDFLNAGLAAGNTQYSSTIESTNGQPLIVTVNQSSAASHRATVYEGPSVADGGKKLVAPSVVKRFYGYNSSISCQNVGTANTALSISYSGTAINKVVAPALAPNAVYQIYQPSDAQLPNNYNGSATIVSSTQPVVCVVNQDQNEAPYSTQVKDVFASYVGIVQAP
jgi:hypothetical protein